MPLLSQHQSNEYTKLLVMGDPGSGKTGALASLVKASYWLGILDYDNGLETLKQFILKECPEKVDNVEFRTLRDKRRAGPEGPVLDGPPRAFMEGLKLLDHWKYKDQGVEVDFGVPAEWGPNRILVLDSTTFMSDSAFDWALPMVQREAKGGKYDMRAVYKTAQDAVENVLALLSSESFRTNVIVIAHVKNIDAKDGPRN